MKTFAFAVCAAMMLALPAGAVDNVGSIKGNPVLGPDSRDNFKDCVVKDGELDCTRQVQPEQAGAGGSDKAEVPEWDERSSCPADSYASDAEACLAKIAEHFMVFDLEEKIAALGTGTEKDYYRLLGMTNLLDSELTRFKRVAPVENPVIRKGIQRMEATLERAKAELLKH